LKYGSVRNYGKGEYVMSDEVQAVRWEKEGNMATVWLCNPAKRNAMGPAFWEQLPRIMEEVSGDDQVRAVALCAEGPSFSVGLDLKSMADIIGGGGALDVPRRMQFLKDLKRLQDSISSVADCPLPVVAALHGWCVGGGVDLVSACDIRVAAKDLTLSIRETRMAMVADVGTLQRLPEIISKGHMNELVYTGKDIDAQRCVEIGLVNSVYDTPQEAIKAAREMASEIAANSPLAVQGVKNVLKYGDKMDVADGLNYVGLWNTAFLFSEDLTEAVTAFLQKRKPRFKGK
jgi:enoyl-CoA hydratase